MPIEGVLAIIAAYLVGSVPVAYIAGRLAKGVDVRERGSGNVGGANVWETVSRRTGVLVVFSDIAKGVVAILIAQAVGLDLPLQVGAGLAAIVGHNWSPFLHFSGGRGVGASLGVLIMLAPWGLAIFLVAALVGLLLKALPVGTGAGFAILPLASWLLEGPTQITSTPITLCCLGMLLLIITRRLSVNRGAIASSGSRKQVLLNRLLFDRDLRDREAWIHKST